MFILPCSELPPKKFRNRPKTRLKSSKGMVRAKTVLSISLKVTTRAQEPSGPQDEAPDSPVVRKQTCTETNAPWWRVPGAFDNCFLNVPLKNRFMSTSAPNGQLPVTSNILMS